MQQASRPDTTIRQASGLRPALRRPLMGSGRRRFGGGGGSFLGTAAAAAAGMVGGSLLLNSIRSMMGGSRQQLRRCDRDRRQPKPQRNPWSDQSGSSLARDAGINDIGSSTGPRRRQFARRIVRSPRMTTSNDDDQTTWIWIPTISATTATAITLDRSHGLNKQNGRSDRAAVFVVRQSEDQITTTLAPTLTRP